MLIYDAYAKALRKGSGFTYQVLADRGYGAVKQTIDVNINLAERMEKLRKRKREEK